MFEQCKDKRIYLICKFIFKISTCNHIYMIRYTFVAVSNGSVFSIYLFCRGYRKVALFYLKFFRSFTASYKVFQNIFNKILASCYINTLHLCYQNGTNDNN